MEPGARQPIADHGSPFGGSPFGGSRPDGKPLAAELRQVLDRLGDAVEEASDLANTVEDAFGVEYPVEPSALPDAAEQVKAALGLPAALTDLRALAGKLSRDVDACQLLLFRLGKATEGLALARAAELERMGKP